MGLRSEAFSTLSAGTFRALLVGTGVEAHPRRLTNKAVARRLLAVIVFVIVSPFGKR
jgi:hypothetical protein